MTWNKLADSLSWSHGHTGKGYLLHDGTIKTWDVDPFNPIDQSQRWQLDHELVPIGLNFEIDPDGGVITDSPTEKVTQILQADPNLYDAGQRPVFEDDWDLNNFQPESQEKNRPNYNFIMSGWDPTICERCGSPMSEPTRMGQRWVNHCMRCGLHREVPSNSPLLKQQQQQESWMPYPDLLKQVGPERPWVFARSESLLPINMNEGCPRCKGPVDAEEGECLNCGYRIPYDGAEQLEGHENYWDMAYQQFPDLQQSLIHDEEYGPRHYGMALRPEDAEHYMAKYGPYMYHWTKPEHVPGILRHGIQPATHPGSDNEFEEDPEHWDDDRYETFDPEKGHIRRNWDGFIETRPGYTYLARPDTISPGLHENHLGQKPYQVPVRVDMRQLNHQNLEADEDVARDMWPQWKRKKLEDAGKVQPGEELDDYELGNRAADMDMWDPPQANMWDGADASYNLPDWAEDQGVNDPDWTRDALMDQAQGALAHYGTIPPQAISLHPDYMDKYPPEAGGLAGGQMSLFGKTADVEGYSNWHTFSVAVEIDNDRHLQAWAHEIVQSDGNGNALRDWAIKKIIAPHNQEAIAEAQEANDIPEDERVDHRYEEFKDKHPEAMDKYHDLIGGPDTSDMTPNLIDPELVNWDEIVQEIQGQFDEEAEHERLHQEVQNSGLTYEYGVGHPLETSQLYDAWLKHHGAQSPEDEQSHITFIPQEQLNPNDFAGTFWQDYIAPHGGWRKPTRAIAADAMVAIRNGTATPEQTTTMQQALAAQGYTPEQIAHIMQPEVQPQPTSHPGLDAPGDTFIPQDWTSHTSANDELHVGLEIPKDIAKQIHDWAEDQDWPKGTELEPISEYHITLLYAPDGHEEHHGADWIEHASGYQVEITGIDEFESDKDKATVLRISSPPLKQRADSMQAEAEDQGLEISKFPGGYKPHLTIAYGPGKPSGAPPKLKFKTGPSSVSTPRKESASKAPKTSYESDSPLPTLSPAAELQQWLADIGQDDASQQSPSIHHAIPEDMVPSPAVSQRVTNPYYPPSHVPDEYKQSAERRSMAERSGFPELDAALAKFMAMPHGGEAYRAMGNELEPQIESYRYPSVAWGQCEVVANQCAAFLKQQGFKAYATADELGAFPGYENAQKSESIVDANGFGAGDFTYPEHAMVEVYDLYGPNNINTVTIDFTASQYGFTEFPKIHPGPSGPLVGPQMAKTADGTINQADATDDPLGKAPAIEPSRKEDAQYLAERICPHCLQLHKPDETCPDSAVRQFQQSERQWYRRDPNAIHSAPDGLEVQTDLGKLAEVWDAHPEHEQPESHTDWDPTGNFEMECPTCFRLLPDGTRATPGRIPDPDPSNRLGWNPCPTCGEMDSPSTERQFNGPVKGGDAVYMPQTLEPDWMGMTPGGEGQYGTKRMGVLQDPVPAGRMSAVGGLEIRTAKVAALQAKYGELLTQPGHKLWFKPNRTEYGRGLVHEPTGAVHTWPESEGTHNEVAYAKGLNPQDCAKFYMNPQGVVIDLGGPHSTLGEIFSADPSIARANGVTSRYRGSEDPLGQWETDGGRVKRSAPAGGWHQVS